MGAVGTAAVRMDGGLQRSHLSTGKLRQEFQTLVRQVTGVPALFTQIAGVLGEFAAGGGITLGVLAGVGAIAGIYSKLTESTRKAREEQDKLTQSMVDQARATRESTVAGADFLKLTAEINLEKVKRESGIGVRSVLGAILGGPQFIATADAEAHAKRIADATTEVEQRTINVGKAWAEANKPIREAKEHVDTASVKTGALADAAARVNAEMLREGRDWWKNYIDQTTEALTITEQLNQAIMAERPSLVESLRSLMPSTPGFTMPNIAMPFEGLTDAQKDSLRELGVLKDDANENAHMIRDAIWGSAAQLANSVVSALNVGGGGRGSAIGGSLGSGLGFAIGSKLGWAGGPIGSVIGGIAGSWIGGLFDHKKAVDNNTAAVRQLTAAYVANAPSGFKVASYRYDATDVQSMGNAARRYAARGGKNPLMVGT